jgi:hypothetical protein
MVILKRFDTVAPFAGYRRTAQPIRQGRVGRSENIPPCCRKSGKYRENRGSIDETPVRKDMPSVLPLTQLLYFLTMAALKIDVLAPILGTHRRRVLTIPSDRRIPWLAAGQLLQSAVLHQ